MGAENRISGAYAGNRMARLEAALEEALEYVERFEDVRDGDDGAPEPNEAMHVASAIRDALDGRWAEKPAHTLTRDLLASLIEVVAIADRKTDAFDRAKAAIARAQAVTGGGAK